MRVVLVFLMVLLAGCDDFGPRRYELIPSSGSVYLLDTKTGRVWEKNLGSFEPQWIMMDSSFSVNKQKLDESTRKALLEMEENLDYKPNSWRDFFRGLLRRLP